MKRWKLFIIFLLSFSAAGCAAHYNVPVVNVTSIQPDILRKTPLNAAILITDQMENYTCTVKDEADLLGTTYTFPLGQIIKKYAFDILSPAFNTAIVVKGDPYPQGTDAIVIPKVEKFQLRLPPAGFSREAVAELSMSLAVYDLNGRPIWKDTINSMKISGNTTFMGEQGLLKATGSVAAESVVVVLQKAAKTIASSREIHSFIAEKGLSETITRKPTVKEAPVVTSDIDTPPAISIKPNPNAYAIVIGIENYRQKLPKADFAAHDAKTISAYLTKTLGYPEENVITLINDRALKSDMEKYFDRWLSNNVEESGKVFIYYSGHGAPNIKTGDAYLVPYDGDPTFIAETGYSIARLYKSLGRLKAKEITVVLDSCFSGAGGRSVLAKGAKPLVMIINTPDVRKNIAVMTASSGDQISSAYEEKGHGLFTYFLLKGIRNEDVVRPDGSIRMDDLFAYVKPRVERIARKQFNNEQTPLLIVGK